MKSMVAPRRFLIVSDDSRGILNVSKTLLRHYPDSMVQECHDLDSTIGLVRNLPAAEHRTVIIAHGTPQLRGGDLVSALRQAHSGVPIVWLGEPGEARLSQLSGATRFLDQAAWLVIGTTVADLT